MKSIFLLGLMLAPLYAASGPGLTGASTLRRAFGARGLGMGEAFVAVDGGLDSIGFNPAGVSAAKRPALQTVYTRGIADDNFSYAGYAHPLSHAVLHTGFIYYDAGSINLNLSNGVREKRKAQQDMVALFGLSLPLPFGFSAGSTLKTYRLVLAEEAHSNGYAFDVGGQWKSPLRGLRFGASVLNAGPDVKFEQEGDPLPLTTRFGAAYSIDLGPQSGEVPAPYFFTRFVITAEGIARREEDTAAAAGTEMYMPFGKVGHGILRFGYLFNRSADSFTFGIGFKEKRFLFDYAMGLKRDISDAHHFSIGYQF